jgi:hypothetical protein
MNNVRRILATCVVLCLFHVGVAISSRSCKKIVSKAYEQYNGKGACHMPICGALDHEKLTMPFLQKLSPSCRAVMERYRVVPNAKVQHGFPQAPWASAPLRVHCATSRAAWFATNPVVVETPYTSSFIMCTVPKVACSSFRKLLNTIIRSPDPAEATTWDQIMKAHFDFYPTMWHYVHRHGNITASHPSFILGRNPYVRVLSGFLNKMVIDPKANEPHDMFNMQDTNEALGRPKNQEFQATRESFSEFVRLVSQRGTVHINDHFQQAGLVCDGGQFLYEFYLRLEDMNEWFPCWEAGLNLREFTRKGWKTTPEGKMYNGVSAECWWKPPGTTCDAYYDAATSPDGTAIPVLDKFVEAEKHDEHDTKSSEKWRHFYTQETGDLLYEAYKPDFLAFGYEHEIFVE